VDTDGWTEDMSMRSLFGDLCSGQSFFYDGEVRLQVEKMAGLQGQDGGKKRKRKQGDSQETASQESGDESESYRTAKVNADDTKSKDDDCQSEKQQVHVRSNDPKIEQKHSRASSEESNRPDNLIVIDSDSEEVSIDHSVFDGMKGGETIYTPNPKHKSQSMVKGRQPAGGSAERRDARIDAYMAAKRCLDESDADEWNW